MVYEEEKNVRNVAGLYTVWIYEISVIFTLSSAVHGKLIHLLHKEGLND